ncbi:MAG: hypothetical protein KC418_17510 [Anaerolineales bacterium]|nr:hypothetical protein [Anaerolineales bacterium]MCB8951688.1 hypothetical protein [Ardenticatenales bacterium]
MFAPESHPWSLSLWGGLTICLAAQAQRRVCWINSRQGNTLTPLFLTVPL